MRRSFMVSYIVDLVGHDQLHQILVGRDDGDVGAAPRAPAAHRSRSDRRPRSRPSRRQGRSKARDRVADQRKLRDQVVRRRRPVRLVFGIELVAEGDLADLSKMTARCVGPSPPCACPRSSFHSMLQKPEHRADRQAVGFARQRRQRVIGAENDSPSRRPGRDGRPCLIVWLAPSRQPWQGFWRERVLRRLWGLISAWPKFRDFCAE